MLMGTQPQSPEMWTNAIIWEILGQMAEKGPVPSRGGRHGNDRLGVAKDTQGPPLSMLERRALCVSPYRAGYARRTAPVVRAASATAASRAAVASAAVRVRSGARSRSV